MAEGPAAGAFSRTGLIIDSAWQRVTTMGLFGLGLPEVAVVAGIAVLVFGKLFKFDPFLTIIVEILTYTVVAAST